DKRQGWRGPEAKLSDDAAEEFKRRAQVLYGDGPLLEGKVYLGLVEKIGGGGALVRVGARSYFLPVANMHWAAPYSAADATNDKQIQAANEALKPNYVVWVKWAWRSKLGRFADFTYDETGEASWLPEQPDAKRAPRIQELTLEQNPRVQGAI